MAVQAITTQTHIDKHMEAQQTITQVHTTATHQHHREYRNCQQSRKCHRQQQRTQ